MPLAVSPRPWMADSSAGRLRALPIVLALVALIAAMVAAPPAHAAPKAQGGTAAPTSTSPGLRGDYYTATGGGTGSTDWTFGSYKNTVVDPNIYFDDLTGRLAQLTGSSVNAAIRWTGNIDVPTTGTYTFNWYGDNGLRLYIDGTAVIDHWINDWNVNVPGSVALTAGRHSFKAEYFQGDGGAFAHLTWATPGQQDQTRIPDSAFTLPDGFVPTVSKAAVSSDGTTVSLTFGQPLGSWPAAATSHLSLGFPVKSAAISKRDPSTLVVTLDGVVHRSWPDLTAGYDGQGGASYADGSTVPSFYASATNGSTVDLTTPWAKDVKKQNPLPDYPRPQLTRKDWKSLNGVWDFEGVSSADALSTPPAARAKFARFDRRPVPDGVGAVDGAHALRLLLLSALVHRPVELAPRAAGHAEFRCRQLPGLGLGQRHEGRDSHRWLPALQR